MLEFLRQTEQRRESDGERALEIFRVLCESVDEN